ncbi:hypothetical protein [Calderihabitans maritimus]|uniref:Uncharacterized protein n=1 Tax=Calderihabitans maritimus TaxID=1246530 RepID=A0A1Z5HSE6_9FIRM|nr:hypothetical protein [Calderihabitans maritimus]GAW92277.1 hypothetical protein KKC1_14330 [Calderihabitans maritimus]
MEKAIHKVADAVDVETFIICRNESEGKKLAIQLLQEMGFTDTDIVSLQFTGPGARVRARAYIHRPGSHYGWL